MDIKNGLTLPPKAKAWILVYKHWFNRPGQAGGKNINRAKALTHKALKNLLF